MPGYNNDPGSERWHLDKRVNVSIIGALLLQAAIFGTWVGGIDAVVEEHERRLSGLERVDDQRSDEMRKIEGRLSTLEANSTAQLDTLRRIERILEARPSP